jgi:hypothetical protein
MVELLRAWTAHAKSPLHDAPVLWRDDFDHRAQAI